MSFSRVKLHKWWIFILAIVFIVVLGIFLAIVRHTRVLLSHTDKLMSEEYEVFDSVANSVKNFGGTNYQCSGTCFCEDRRRTVAASSAISRGVSVLLSAFSLLMAVNIAKELFQDRCTDIFGSECEEYAVFAEVDECSKSKEESDSDGSSHPGELKYECRGRCVEYDPGNYLPNKYHRLCGEIDCSQFEYSAAFTWDRKKYSYSDGYKGQFKESLMEDFCFSKSRIQGFKIKGKKMKPIIDKMKSEQFDFKRGSTSEKFRVSFIDHELGPWEHLRKDFSKFNKEYWPCCRAAFIVNEDIDCEEV